jgi:hypothetical protein
VEVSSRVIDVDGMQHRESFVRDITERRAAEAQLTADLAELRRWNEATLGREARVLDLKREVNETLAQVGELPRYPSATDDAGAADG